MPKRKDEKPRTLEMPLDAAIEPPTDAAEVPPGQPQTFDLTLRDVKILQHQGDVCLNDLWMLAGEPENIRPSNWLRQKGTQKFLAALRAKLIVSDKHNKTKSSKNSLCYVLGGGRSRTSFAHPTLALEYARHLSPELAVEVNELFIRFKADAVGLAIQILEDFSEQAEFGEMRVELRQLAAKHNKESAGVAQDAGVKNFEAYNGAGLRGLYGGKTKAEVLKHKGLAKRA